LFQSREKSFNDGHQSSPGEVEFHPGDNHPMKGYKTLEKCEEMRREEKYEKRK